MASEELTTVTLRLPTPLVDKIKTRAEDEDRSLNNMVKIMLAKLVGGKSE